MGVRCGPFQVQVCRRRPTVVYWRRPSATPGLWLVDPLVLVTSSGPEMSQREGELELGSAGAGASLEAHASKPKLLLERSRL